MKQLLLSLMFVATLPLFGQTSQQVTSITFYGIDYSLARVYGAAESPTQFLNAFGEINRLFISEPKKYDMSKFTRKKLNSISLDAVNQVNEKINLHDLIVTTPDYAIDEAQLTLAVRLLPIKDESEGTGVVIIAQLLNKVENNASYKLVYFDIATREVIESVNIDGKSAGFGLRNFWAGSIYKALKKMRY